MIILHEFKEMAKIVIKHHHDLNFDRIKTLRKSTNTFNYRIFTDILNFHIVCYFWTNIVLETAIT